MTSYAGSASMVLAFFTVLFALFLVASFRPALLVWVAFLVGPFPFAILLPSPSIATPLGEIQVSALVGFAILCGTVVAIALNFRAVARHVTHYALFIVFIFYCAVSAMWASDFAMVLRMLLKLSTPLLFSMLVAGTVQRFGPRTVVNAVVTSGVVYAAFSTLSWILGWGDGPFFTYPGNAASVSSGHLLTPFSVLLAETAVNPQMGRIVLTALLGGAIVAGFTRITIGGLFAAAGVILFNRAKGVLRIGALAGGVLGFIALFTFVDAFRARMFGSGADGISFGSVLEDPARAFEAIGGSGRYSAWRSALDRLFTPHPLTGSGLGSAQHMFYNNGSGVMSATHSEVVRLLCDVGILGLVLYAFAWLQLLWVGTHGWRRVADPEVRSMKLAGLGSVVAYLVFMLTDNGFDYMSQMALFAFGVIGAAIGLTTVPVRSVSPASPIRFNIAPRVIGNAVPPVP